MGTALAAIVGRASDGPSVDIATAALTALGWPVEAIRSHRSRVGGETVVVRRRQLPVGLVLVDPHGRTGPADAVSLGYSAEAPVTLWWGVESAESYDTLRWSQRPGDTTLGQSDTDDLIGMSDVLSVLSPAMRGRTGSRLGRPHQVLHETLGRALSKLRQQVMDVGLFAGRPDDEADLALLRAFHQLLFIRFHEDRHGYDDLPRLKGLVGSANLPSRLAEVVEVYRERHNSELFNDPSMTLVDVPDHALREVVDALTEPWDRLQLDFSLASNDLAGRLYQSYLQLRPVPTNEGRLLAVAEPVDRRARQGAYYTPPALAERIVAESLGRWLARARPSRPRDVRVLDPACGSGAFLLAAFRQLVGYFEAHRGRALRRSDREAILRECLFGADIDASATLIAQVHLLEEADLGDRRLPSMSGNLLVGDSLADADEPGAIDWRELFASHGRFSVVVTNPPFGSQQKLLLHVGDRRAEMRARFTRTRQFRSDSAYMFVERALELLDDDGVAGFVLPRAAIADDSGSALRATIADIAVAVTDYRAARPFAPVNVYVSTLIVDRRASNTISVTAMDDTSEIALDAAPTVFTVGRDALASAVDWSAFSLRWTELREKIGCPWEPFGNSPTEQTVVTQGTQVGRQDALTIPSDQVRFEGSRAIVDGHEVDARRLPRLARGPNIHPFVVWDGGERLFLPFQQRDELLGPYDDAVAAVVERRGGKPANPQPGNLPVHLGPKVLVRGLAYEPAAAADVTGDCVTVKGTAGGLAVAFPERPASFVLAAAGLFNSALYQWLLRGFGSPKANGWVEIKVNQVERLPWPILDDQDWEVLAQLAATVTATLEESDPRKRAIDYRAARKHLDETVFDLLAVGNSLVDTIRAELVREA